MSKVSRLGEAASHMWQWKTDKEPCDQHALSAGYREVVVEAKGDLGGKPLVITGGITDGDLPIVGSTKHTPWIARIPAVLFIQPVTEAEGVTITVRGIL